MSDFDIGELVKRLNEAAFYNERQQLLEEAARALSTLEARCTELEKEIADAMLADAYGLPVEHSEFQDAMVPEAVLDRAIDAYHAAAGKSADWDGVEAAIKVALAALAHRIEREPVVKALEWKGAWDGRHEQWFATSAFGDKYEVKHFPYNFAYSLSIREKPFVEYATEQEAKAAAQADYERRILSTLKTN